MNIRYIISVITALGMVMVPVNVLSAPAVEPGDAAFPRSINSQGIEMNLHGTAQLKYLIFIEAYTGALYLPAGVDGSQAIEDVPKHLVLRYHVSISSRDFSEATRSKIKESVNPEAYVRLLPKIETLNQWYQDVKPDDRYALTYVPKNGVTLFLNDIPLGTVHGKAFARAVFSIWLGDNPIDGTFRDQLIGKSR